MVQRYGGGYQQGPDDGRNDPGLPHFKRNTNILHQHTLFVKRGSKCTYAIGLLGHTDTENGPVEKSHFQRIHLPRTCMLLGRNVDQYETKSQVRQHFRKCLSQYHCGMHQSRLHHTTGGHNRIIRWCAQHRIHWNDSKRGTMHLWLILDTVFFHEHHQVKQPVVFFSFFSMT